MTKMRNSSDSLGEEYKLTGIWYVNADPKGRVTLPTALYESMDKPEELVGIKFGKKSAILITTPDLLKANVDYAPLLSRNMFLFHLDTARRISPSKDFQKAALGESLAGREVVITGEGDHLTLWPRLVWEEQESQKNQAELAGALEKIFKPSNE